MRNFFCAGTVVLFSVFFFACEEDAMPVPFPLPPPSAMGANADLPPPAAASTAPAPVAENQKVVQILDPLPDPPSTPPPAPTRAAPPPQLPPTPAFISSPTDAEQLKSGRYTIQVAIFPIEASAKSLVKKMSERGIKSYYAKVENPAKLLGTYYRVRVGYFNGRSAAETFAKEKLEPLGYAWYVDAARNDTVGNPAAAAPAAPATGKPVASAAPAKAPAANSAKAPTANSELEKAKQEYKEIAKQAQAAKQSSSSPKAPPPKAPPPAESNW